MIGVDPDDIFIQAGQGQGIRNISRHTDKDLAGAFHGDLPVQGIDLHLFHQLIRGAHQQFRPVFAGETPEDTAVIPGQQIISDGGRTVRQKRLHMVKIISCQRFIHAERILSGRIQTGSFRVDAAKNGDGAVKFFPAGNVIGGQGFFTCSFPDSRRFGRRNDRAVPVCFCCVSCVRGYGHHNARRHNGKCQQADGQHVLAFHNVYLFTFTKFYLYNKAAGQALEAAASGLAGPRPSWIPRWPRWPRGPGAPWPGPKL